MTFPSMAEQKIEDDQLVDRLASMLSQWQTTGVEPALVGALSSGERAAIFMAGKHESRLSSPLCSFLVLEVSLQKWILVERGMTNFVGTKIAGEYAPQTKNPHIPTQQWHDSQSIRLGKIADEWLLVGAEPTSFSSLSTSEQAAVAIVVGEEKLMRSPLTTFLLFSPYLQRFVLGRIGLEVMIGQPVGIEAK